MAEEQDKKTEPEENPNVFRLRDQPSIEVEGMDGKTKTFPSDMALMQLLEAGIGTAVVDDDRRGATKTVIKIISELIGEPIGPTMAWAIVTRMTTMLKEFTKKAGATPDSDTTTESEEQSTSEPAP